MRRGGYSLLQRFLVAIIKPALLVATKRQWRGQEHVPATGGMILAANHLSWTDPLAISHFLHEAGRWPVFLTKSELFRVPVLGRVVKAAGQVPVYRSSTDAGKALAAAERALADGACVIFYPEGTCTRDPELWPMSAKTGVARLALRTGAPVIPLAHWGPHDLLPYGKKCPRLAPRRTMRLAAGPPVDLSEYAVAEQSPSAATLRAATDKVTVAITGLLAELRGQQPPRRIYVPEPGRGTALEGGTSADTNRDGPAVGGPEPGRQSVHPEPDAVQPGESHPSGGGWERR